MTLGLEVRLEGPEQGQEGERRGGLSIASRMNTFLHVSRAGRGKNVKEQNID